MQRMTKEKRERDRAIFEANQNGTPHQRLAEEFSLSKSAIKKAIDRHSKLEMTQEEISDPIDEEVGAQTEYMSRIAVPPTAATEEEIKLRRDSRVLALMKGQTAYEMEELKLARMREEYVKKAEVIQICKNIIRGAIEGMIRDMPKELLKMGYSKKTCDKIGIEMANTMAAKANSAIQEVLHTVKNNAAEVARRSGK